MTKEEELRNEFANKVAKALSDRGFEEQVCARCQRHFTPIDDGGTWSIDEGFVCYQCYTPDNKVADCPHKRGMINDGKCKAS